MARLFITPREIDFMNDIAKELVKDVAGQKIYLYQISEIKSRVHDVYEEAQDKIFDNPIEVDCFVKYEPQSIKTDNFGSEEYSSITVYIQSRDLLDKEIEILEGDFFSYGEIFFEIVTAPTSETLFGQVEHDSYTTLTGKQARRGQFVSKVYGPTSESYNDQDAVQDTFYQQRGFDANRLGETADVRDLRKKGVLEDPITGPKEISDSGTSTNAGNSFYDE
tara:strand:+ start:1633 stop:2295 length:663 start_codon:yes stop_codon:yes gene_type:complete